MRQFYTVTQKIKDTLIADDFVNTVRLGDPTEVDLKKNEIFPSAHIIPGSVTHNGSTLSMGFDVLVMDIVDVTKDELQEVVDPFHGVDNLQDVWNTQLQVANRLIVEMQRGSLHRDLFQTDTATIAPFKDRFENLLAGWVISLTVTVPNNEICVDG